MLEAQQGWHRKGADHKYPPGARQWAFFSIVGGLSVFGASGLILGPVIFALTDAILEIWRRRTAYGKPAEEATTPTAGERSGSEPQRSERRRAW